MKPSTAAILRIIALAMLFFTVGSLIYALFVPQYNGLQILGFPQNLPAILHPPLLLSLCDGPALRTDFLCGEPRQAEPSEHRFFEHTIRAFRPDPVHSDRLACPNHPSTVSHPSQYHRTSLCGTDRRTPHGTHHHGAGKNL